MKKIASLIMCIFLATGHNLVFSNENAIAAKDKAIACVSCHGVNGISNGHLWPNLAGQNVSYLIKQLHAFRDESRKDPMMNVLAKTLSDDDIKDLSKYYSELK
jgi:cytochrome c553